LSLCKGFTCRNPQVNEQLKKDLEEIEKISVAAVARGRSFQLGLYLRRNVGALIGGFFLLAVIVLAVISSTDSKNVAQSGTSRPPKETPDSRGNPPQIAPRPLGFDPKGFNTIRSREESDLEREARLIDGELARESQTIDAMKVELDRDRQVIDSEKATADQMATRLEDLRQDIDLERALLDRTNQSQVDEFNRKVEAHNDLLERARAQDRLINRLVDDYNEKLRKCHQRIDNYNEKLRQSRR
jgi:hypothetical protein